MHYSFSLPHIQMTAPALPAGSTITVVCGKGKGKEGRYSLKEIKYQFEQALTKYQALWEVGRYVGR